MGVCKGVCCGEPTQPTIDPDEINKVISDE